MGIETSSLLSLRHFATGTGTNIYLLEFIKYEKALCIVSADHEKTFDTADHQILSQKLYHRGIWGLAHAWFKSYFCFLY